MTTLTYFRASDGKGGLALWRTDGTQAGTVELSGAVAPDQFVALGAHDVFVDLTHGGLWTTDGTQAGTTALYAPSFGLYPTELTSFGSVVLFNGADSTGARDLYMTDGTAAGTRALAVAGSFGGEGLDPHFLVRLGPVVLFEGNGPTGNGPTLWETNGTAAGTQAIAAAGEPAGFALDPYDITVYGDHALFSGTDTAGNGSGLWVTDGSAKGTTELAVADASPYGLDPSNLTELGGKMLFVGMDTSGTTALFSTDGTSAGTHALASFGADGQNSVNPGSDLSQLAEIDGRVVFAVQDFQVFGTLSSTIWVSDGTAAGTHALAIAGGASSGLFASGFTPISSTEMLFGGNDAAGGNGLWTTDGTAAGTHELSIAGARQASAGGLAPQNFLAVNGGALFQGVDAAGHLGLWETDGTADGTHEVLATVGRYDLAPVAFGPDPPLAPAVPCFLEGTTLATPWGDRRVETLRMGDLVLAEEDGCPVASAITWIGERSFDPVDSAVSPSLHPVRIARDAFGPGRPARDLYLSPDHAVFARGVLVPVRHLIDGVHITQPVWRRPFRYLHVMLARHSVLRAHGLPVESFLDTGNLGQFSNAGVRSRVGPGLCALAWEAGACAPMQVCGPLVDAIRASLGRVSDDRAAA